MVKVYRRTFFQTGIHTAVRGEVVATMNYSHVVKKGTHAGTHEDYEKNVLVHKVESFINGNLSESLIKLETESEVIGASQTLMSNLQMKMKKLADEIPLKTFDQKMQELFSHSNVTSNDKE